MLTVFWYILTVCMDDREKKSLLEALLLISGEPLTPSALKGITALDEPEIRSIMGDLTADYQTRDGW